MLTLFTGNPRSGKTASLVDTLIDIDKQGRAIYVHAPTVKRVGVDPFHTHLQIPHHVVDADRWPELVPDGAVLVIDEVQDLWRPRPPGQKVPEAIRELETHGHRGIDIFCTSQKPRLVDSGVRDMVGRHVHIRDTGWFGRWMYEWPEMSETLAWKTCKLKKRFKVPKRTFDLYKSANVHTKPIRGMSFLPMIAGVLLVGALVLVALVYRTIAAKTDPRRTTPEAATLLVAPQATPKGKQGPAEVPSAPAWPVYVSKPPEPMRDPLAGKAVQWEGGYSYKGAQHAMFGVVLEGQRVATLSLADLVRMGYTWTEYATCIGRLKFGEQERDVTCAKPQHVEPRSTRNQSEPTERAVSPPAASLL